MKYLNQSNLSFKVVDKIEVFLDTILTRLISIRFKLKGASE